MISALDKKLIQKIFRKTSFEVIFSYFKKQSIITDLNYENFLEKNTKSKLLDYLIEKLNKCCEENVYLYNKFLKDIYLVDNLSKKKAIRDLIGSDLFNLKEEDFKKPSDRVFYLLIHRREDIEKFHKVYLTNNLPSKFNFGRDDYFKKEIDFLSEENIEKIKNIIQSKLKEQNRGEFLAPSHFNIEDKNYLFFETSDIETSYDVYNDGKKEELNFKPIFEIAICIDNKDKIILVQCEEYILSEITHIAIADILFDIKDLQKNPKKNNITNIEKITQSIFQTRKIGIIIKNKESEINQIKLVGIRFLINRKRKSIEDIDKSEPSLIKEFLNNTFSSKHNNFESFESEIYVTSMKFLAVSKNFDDFPFSISTKMGLNLKMKNRAEIDIYEILKENNIINVKK